jgi:S-DNA-T family DNA segregation ATPase FtsK/SpoIIIE
LLVDNFPAFKTEFEIGPTRAPWYAAFQQILGEGRSVGIHVAITADRPGSVNTATSSAFQRRVVHRLADEGSYALLDAPSDVLSSTSPPGRAVVDGMEAQIAIVGGHTGVAEQSKALQSLAEAMLRAGRAVAEPIGALSTEIDPATLPTSIGDQPVLGVSDDTLDAMPFDDTGAILLAGPPASGRTSALRWLIHSIGAAHPKVTRYYIGNPRSTIGAQPGWEATARTVEDAADLAKEITSVVNSTGAGTKVLVVIEQIGDFLSTSADSSIVELIKAVKRSDHVLIADSETSQWSSSWPILAEVKAARTGFLLQPDGLEGENLLRTPLPRVSRSEFPPGRGYFIARGKATRVQLPFMPQ